MTTVDNIISASLRHPKPQGAKFNYGTAGFRMQADLLDSVVYRVGISAALRSRKLNGQTVGIMITASHNPAPDNGIKLVDPQGGMLETSWETYVTSLANAETTEELQKEIEKTIKTTKIDIQGGMNVIYARDTRPSGEILAKTLKDALDAIGATSTDYGIKTTPQLHYLVRALNTVGTVSPYGEPTESGYYQKLANAFRKLVKEKPGGSTVYVDCANGVGGPKLRELKKYLGEEVLDLVITQDDVCDPEMLNRQCGADFVKTFQKPPPGTKLVPFERHASLDGDADRIIYYYAGQDRSFHLLDGDKIAGLAAVFFQDLVKSAGIDLKIGIVQTAYANGNSTNYLTKTLKLPVTCVATGVKHLHHAAQRYDIGVYFEANGHGTVLFSPTALALLENHEASSPAQHSALESLRGLSNLINQTVGDALSDLLFVEAILASKGWGPSEWDSAYTDLPNRLFKKVVKDRSLFVTTDAERKLVKPEGLQEKIDELVAKYSDGRAFVRASGTEDLVRIYAEAKTRSEADDLGMRIMALVS